VFVTRERRLFVTNDNAASSWESAAIEVVNEYGGNRRIASLSVGLHTLEIIRPVSA